MITTHSHVCLATVPMKTEFQHIITSAILLGLFALVGVSVIAGLQVTTKDRIAANREATRLRSMNAVVGSERYDNEILNDQLIVQDEMFHTGGKPVTIFRARKNGRPVAAIFDTVAPRGYSGPIYLLIGVNLDGTLSGVRVLAHTETPGLGDAIDDKHSDWILGFEGKSLLNPGREKWGVKRDGGAFDQFTGATISPRLVVKSIRDTLDYYASHQTDIFPSLQAEQPSD